MKSKKLLLIGIDSASPDLIERWIDSLPNLKALMNQGSFGKLRSTIPPLSAPAWTSMVTGKNPGKTGVFDWIRAPNRAGEKPEIVYLNDVEEPKIWDLLGKKGIRSYIVNLPLSYPPSKLSGGMVSGIPGHIGEGNITNPPSLKAELDRVVGGYEVYPTTDLRIPGKEAEYLTDFRKTLEKRIKATLYLVDEKEWDFFMVVFFVLDSVQHYFWKHMDRQHPQFDPELSERWGNAIKQFYTMIDESVGEIVKSAGNGTNVLIVSDHGMGPLYGSFSMNNFLTKRGLLVPKGNIDGSSSEAKLEDELSRKIVEIGRNLPEFLRNTGKRVLPFQWKEKLSLRGQVKRSGDELLRLINWDETKAYALGESAGIFLNEKSDREIVKSELEKVRPPIVRNETPIEIHERDQIYEGPYVSDLPDLLCLIDRYQMRTSLTTNGELWSSSILSGYHTRNGILVARGPSFKSTSSPHRSRIYDIMPTILSLFDVAIPSDLDGKPLKSILK